MARKKIKHNKIKGTNENDRLNGTSDHDEIFGKKGDDKLFGRAGNDILDGGRGNDRLVGGRGHDELWGDGSGSGSGSGSSNDYLDGGRGNDLLVGGQGNDQLFGGAGADRLYGDAYHGSGSGSGSGYSFKGHGSGKHAHLTFDDHLDGGAGADHLVGGIGNDTMVGGTGNDKLFGDFENGGSGSGSGSARGSYDDSLDGGKGDDLLVGGQGNDTLLGGEGDDKLIGDYQKDWDDGAIQWYTFDDYLDGGAGNDKVRAGQGEDIAAYSVGENRGFHDDYNGGKGVDTLRINLTKDEWLELNAAEPKLQSDFTDYLAFLDARTNGGTREANGKEFAFQAIDLVAKRFEKFEVFVDGTEINPADEPVTALDDLYLGDDGVIEDGGSITGSVIDNDEFPDFFREVRLITDVEADKGILTLNPDGSFEYGPGDDFQYLGVGDEELVSFVYEAEDADGDTEQATATIMVTGTNDAPIAAMATASGLEDTPITGQLTATDVDNEQSELTYSLDTGPSNGSVTVNSDGTFSYTGNQDYAGPDSFTFLVSDGDGGFDTEIVNIDVAAVADAPTIEVEALAGDSVNHIRLVVTATQADLDGSEYIDSITSSLPAGATLTPGFADPGGTPGQVTQEFLLTLPENTDSNFDLVFTAESVELSNGSTATNSVTIPIVYDYTATTNDITFNAQDESIWGTGDQFQFVDDRFVGLDTGPFSQTFGSTLYAGVSGDIKLGIQSKIQFGGGQIDAAGNYDVTVNTSYNKTTDQLFIDTAALLKGTSFATEGPTGALSLDLVSKIILDAYAGVNVDFGSIDFDPAGIIPGDQTLDLGGINERVDIGSINLPETIKNLLSVDSNTLAGEIPFPPPLDAFAIEFDWPDIVTTGSATDGSATSSGASDNFLQLVFDLDDLAFQLYGLPVNPLDPPYTTQGPFFVDYDLLDLDTFGGLNLKQDFDLALGGLTGTLMYEDSTTQTFTFGEDVTINDAASIDAGGDGDGIVEFKFSVSPDADLSNETDLGFNFGVRPSVFEAEIGYNVTIPNPFGDDISKSDSIKYGPLATYTETVPIGDIAVYNDTFDLDFEPEIIEYDV